MSKDYVPAKARYLYVRTEWTCGNRDERPAVPRELVHLGAVILDEDFFFGRQVFTTDLSSEVLCQSDPNSRRFSMRVQYDERPSFLTKKFTGIHNCGDPIREFDDMRISFRRFLKEVDMKEVVLVVDNHFQRAKLLELPHWHRIFKNESYIDLSTRHLEYSGKMVKNVFDMLDSLAATPSARDLNALVTTESREPGLALTCGLMCILELDGLGYFPSHDSSSTDDSE